MAAKNTYIYIHVYICILIITKIIPLEITLSGESFLLGPISQSMLLLESREN